MVICKRCKARIHYKQNVPPNLLFIVDHYNNVIRIGELCSECTYKVVSFIQVGDKESTLDSYGIK